MTSHCANRTHYVNPFHITNYDFFNQVVNKTARGIVKWNFILGSVKNIELYGEESLPVPGMFRKPKFCPENIAAYRK